MDVLLGFFTFHDPVWSDAKYRMARRGVTVKTDCSVVWKDILTKSGAVRWQFMGFIS